MYKSIILKFAIISMIVILLGFFMGNLSPFNLKNSITPDQLTQMLNTTDYNAQFIDVSTKNIFNQNKITGFINIEYSSFEKDYSKLGSLDKKDPVIIISNREGISRDAVSIFRHAGFEDVKFVIGDSISYLS